MNEVLEKYELMIRSCARIMRTDPNGAVHAKACVVSDLAAEIERLQSELDAARAECERLQAIRQAADNVSAFAVDMGKSYYVKGDVMEKLFAALEAQP
jgi:hypothetical protein